MKGLLVFLLVVAAVNCDVGEYVEESTRIELIEKTLGPSTFSIQGTSSDPSIDVAPATQGQRNFVEDLIKDTIDGFRDVIVSGNEVLPPLDPLVVAQAGPFEFNDKGIRASVTARNVRLEGLQWYTVDNVNFNLLRLGFGLKTTLPWINFSSDYNARVRLALLITHNAGGTLRVFVNRLEVSVDGRLGTNLLGGGHLTLREFNLNIFIADVQIRFEGLTGSSVVNAMINTFVQGLTRDVIQNQLEEISQDLSLAIFELVNETLREYTLDDLLGIGSRA